MTALVSVIIPNYNYGAYVAKAIDSVLAQTYSDIEIIVVDDGSRDDSLLVLEKYGDRITVVAQKNQGVSTARNNGVSVSRGEFVAFLDADDMWLPSKIEKQIAKLVDGDDTVGLVHCSMSYIDKDEQIIGETRNGKEGWLAADLLLLQEATIGVASTGLVRRAVFDEVGGFDARQTTAADWDFSYRVAKTYRIGFVSEPLVLYRLHNLNMHLNIRAMEHDVKIGFEKAFSDNPPEVQYIRRECYGNFHYMLAGSYFKTGNYSSFATNTLKSLWYRPGMIKRYFGKLREHASG
jgi:glycosyltransferase involved in cell wall biosynthesis